MKLPPLLLCLFAFPVLAKPIKCGDNLMYSCDDLMPYNVEYNPADMPVGVSESGDPLTQVAPPSCAIICEDAQRKAVMTRSGNQARIENCGGKIGIDCEGE